jgi:hypothetical protein
MSLAETRDQKKDKLNNQEYFKIIIEGVEQ